MWRYTVMWITIFATRGIPLSILHWKRIEEIFAVSGCRIMSSVTLRKVALLINLRRS